MEEKRVNVIKMRVGMMDPRGRLIPRGVKEEITIEVGDGVATYWFRNRRVTKNFAMVEIHHDLEKKIPQRTIWVERVGKAVRRYEGMNKEDIRDYILEKFKELKLNAKLK